MGGVNANHVHARFDECRHPLQQVGRYAHGCPHAQTPQLVFARIGTVFALDDVAVRYQPHQFVVFINDGQFLNFVFLQNILGIFQFHALGARDEVFFGHNFGHGLGQVFLKTQIAVGNNAHQFVGSVHHGNTANFELGHDALGIGQRRVFGQRDGVHNHATFGAFHLANLRGLLLNTHVFVDNANAALLGNGHGQLVFGNGVHGGRQQRNVDLNLARKLSLGAGVAR